MNIQPRGMKKKGHASRQSPDLEDADEDLTLVA